MAVDSARVEKLRKKSINGQSMKRLVEAGLTWLRTNQQTVNALNVFPALTIRTHAGIGFPAALFVSAETASAVRRACQFTIPAMFVF